MTWTAERTERAKTLCLDGLSATQIAADLGDTTRNAVQGKMLRLGLRLRGGSANSKGGRPKTRTFVNAVAVNHNREARKSDKGVTEKLREHNASPLLIPLIELKPRHCRWPVGDPGTEGFGFCGHARKDQSPYCPTHHNIAYVPLRRRAG